MIQTAADKQDARPSQERDALVRATSAFTGRGPPVVDHVAASDAESYVGLHVRLRER
jgi:hypothetical protein